MLETSFTDETTFNANKCPAPKSKALFLCLHQFHQSNCIQTPIRRNIEAIQENIQLTGAEKVRRKSRINSLPNIQRRQGLRNSLSLKRLLNNKKFRILPYDIKKDNQIWTRRRISCTHKTWQ